MGFLCIGPPECPKLSVLGIRSLGARPQMSSVFFLVVKPSKIIFLI